MAAVQSTSSQRQTGLSRTQTPSNCIPLQKTAAPSTSQPPGPQSITPQSHTQPPPVSNKLPTSSGIWTVPLTGTIIACVALVVALIFGIGAWIGQEYGNNYARKSYEITLWGLCADHLAIQENEVCHDSLRDGLHRSVKRDLAVTMQLGALSQVNNFRSHLVSWSICLLATTTWISLHTSLTSLVRSIYFHRSYNATEERRKQGFLNSACIASATTTTASLAHILNISRSGLLVAASFDTYSRSCLITCFSLILCRAFLGISYKYRMKPASKRSKDLSRILYLILSTNNWFFIHEFLTQANNDNIEVTLILEFLYFNLCLAAFALLVHWPPSKSYENALRRLTKPLR